MARDPYPWQPIKPLDAEFVGMRGRSPRLNALAAQWETERASLRRRGAETQLLEEMKNRMAIETGILEGLYDISRGVTETLITRGFETSLLPHGETNRDPRLVIETLKDQRAAVDYVFELVKADRPLSTSVIKELHVLLTRTQDTTTGVDQLGKVREMPLLRGEWKQRPNNPTRPDGQVHQYSPPEHVDAEMDQLIYWYREYESQGTSPHILAAWMHHRFTQIHPFQDGNGRLARLLATIVFLHADWHPLVVLRDDRSTYIDALEQADAGHLTPLAKLFARWQSRAFVTALGAVHATEERLAKDAALAPRLDDVLLSLRDRLAASTAPEHVALDHLADRVMGIVHSELDYVRDRIDATLSSALPKLSIRTGRSGENDQSYKGPRIAFAKQYGFFADFTRGSQWARLVLRTAPHNDNATLLVSSTAVGSGVGTIALTAGLIRTDPETRSTMSAPTCEEPFLVTAEELADSTAWSELEARLRAWVQDSATLAIAQWQRDLG
ncbi:MAG: Fic family protein [Mobilicoccus sp.]|nr:Fic family protein [Mobilicoccus sp.]